MAAVWESYLFIHLKSFPIGICWFTQQGEQEKKMLKKNQNGCGFGNLSIHLKIFSHRNLLVYRTRGAAWWGVLIHRYYLINYLRGLINTAGIINPNLISC